MKENKGYFIAMNNFFFCYYLKHVQVDIILFFFSKMIVESRLYKSGLHFIPAFYAVAGLKTIKYILKRNKQN